MSTLTPANCSGLANSGVPTNAPGDESPASEADSSSVFARPRSIIFAVTPCSACSGVVGFTVSSKQDWPDSTPPARALRSMQTGQNSITPENSLPQIEQVRLLSVFMGLTALLLRSEPRKGHGSPRQSLPDLTPCGQPPLAIARCNAFATDGSVF